VEAPLELLHSVARCTVAVDVNVPPGHPTVAVLGLKRSGSGTVVDEAGLVLVPNYVVVGADSVKVTDLEGSSVEGRVIAHDYGSGLAVVDIDKVVPAIAPGDSNTVDPGSDVFIVAATEGMERRTASGVVTSAEPFDAYWEYRLERALSLSVASPGQGGGALANSRGELLGIVSLNLGIVGRQSLAIPAENFYDHSEELLASGRRVSRPARAWIGMLCYSLPGQTVLAGIMPESPGERAGLHAGDVMLALDDTELEDRADLYHLLWMHKPGDTVRLRVQREGEILDLPVVTGDAEDYFSSDEIST